MDANFFHGFQGLDALHLIAFLILAIIALRSPIAKTAITWATGGKQIPFVGNGNGGGNSTKAAIDGINTRLDTHEAECLRRNDEIQSDIRAIKSDVSTLKTDTAGMKTDIAWIKQLLSYRKGGSDA